MPDHDGLDHDTFDEMVPGWTGQASERDRGNPSRSRHFGGVLITADQMYDMAQLTRGVSKQVIGDRVRSA
ncbi:hypothetical protein [Mycobacterium simulans]|uniref:hypothetical protein n=1 Tax=Mycobacterium simulans TaxID=627089 RepID=UPI00174D531F|nr:hypothetical protein [Mycobacterium simulans]